MLQTAVTRPATRPDNATTISQHGDDQDTFAHSTAKQWQSQAWAFEPSFTPESMAADGSWLKKCCTADRSSSCQMQYSPWRGRPPSLCTACPSSSLRWGRRRPSLQPRGHPGSAEGPTSSARCGRFFTLNGSVQFLSLLLCACSAYKRALPSGSRLAGHALTTRWTYRL